MMAEELRRKYPGRYDLPSEVEMQGFIGAEGARRSSAISQSSSQGRSRRRLPLIYLHYLTRMMCESQGKIKPSDAVVKLKECCDSSAEDFPSDEQIKRRISAMKRTHKKSKRLPDIPAIPQT